MLEVAGLATRAGDFRLARIDLRVGEGECHAVLGPSGSGKSTLLNALLGVLPATAGEVWVGGVEITRLPIEQRGLGYVPQRLGLFPHLSVLDNLLYSARARGVAATEYRPLLDRLVEITGVGPLLDRRIATLSGGERQRVALVRALAANPRVVLLDEPFTALNESLRRELWWLLLELQRERGLAVLLITHDLTEAYFLARHITVLIAGRPEQSDAKETVFRRPASLAVARFLGIKNLFPAVVIGHADGIIEAECAILGQRFLLPGDAPTGARIWLGIRREDVALRDAEHPPRPGERVLTGAIRLTDLGSDVAALLQTADNATTVELTLYRRTARRFGLADGQAGVTVALPEQAMFWVPDA